MAQDLPSAINPPTRRVASIELSAIGYHEPSRLERLSEDKANVSLNFVDANHVLLTFNPKKLFKRLPGCAPEHDDRLVHAAVLELPSGKAVKATDLYLHDHRRYLWPLGPGKLLLRRQNDLYIVDSSLREKLLMSSPKDLLWVTVTPDGRQIVVETARDTKAVGDSKLPRSPQAPVKPEPKFLLEFLDAKSLVPQRTLQLNEVADLEGTSGGYVDFIHKGDIWLIRFGPSASQRRNITRVRSRTIPSVFYASNNSLVIGRCPSVGCDYSVTAFTVSGHRLWRKHWNQARYFPAVARSEDNSRFVVSTLRHSASADAAGNSENEAKGDQNVVSADGLDQDVQVFETASGSPVLSLRVSPAMMSGQNFSLSPDGRRLAVLQGSGLELFDLPKVSDEEQAKFSALKADVPDQYMLASTPDSISALDVDARLDKAEESTQLTAKVATEEGAGKLDDSNSRGSVEDANHQPSPVDGQSFSNAPPASDATGQSTEESGEPVTTIKVSTKAVVVDVVVTDAKGHPVKGLRQNDFHLMEDGTPQDALYFREFTDVDARSPRVLGEAAPAKPPHNVFSNDIQIADPGPATMILLDLVNTSSKDQVYARQQLIRFLENKAKNARFALCALSSGTLHLRLIQGFTQDETQLLAAVKGKKGAPHSVYWHEAAGGTQNVVDTVAELAQGGAASGWQSLLRGLEAMQAEQQGTDTDRRVGITMDSLMQLARYLAGFSGRKNLVWLSGSFPISIPMGANLNNAALTNHNYADRIKRITNLFAEAQIAVYPVDVRGVLATNLSAGAGNAGLAPVGGPTALAAGELSTNGGTSVSPNDVFQQRMMQELAQQAAERDTLTEVATATGGKAFYSSNAIQEAITSAVEQGTNYYTLSYNPTNKLYNGKFRKIKVVLAEKGYSLHYRQGYFADDSSVPPKDTNADGPGRTRAEAMQHGAPPSRQILFSVQVLPLGVKKKVDRAKVGEVVVASLQASELSARLETQHYGIDYSLNSSALRFIPRENGNYHSVLALMVASFDHDGRMLTGISNVGASDLEPAVYKDMLGKEFQVHQEIDVPVEAVSLRLGIQDLLSDRLGTVEIPLPVLPPPGSHRRVNPTLPEIEPD